MADERLQKVLARAGIASRRAAEELITKGRVKVDGRVIDQLGVRIDPRKAKVEVDGKRLMAEPLVYIVLHKPRGVMCTLSDPEGRPTVAELLKPVGVRVVPVGRLDFHTSGALLCTNDGDFANALAHPRNKAQKVYVAKVQGLVLDHQLDDWRKSIEIDGRATAPAEVRRLRYEGDKTWLELTLREGRNRQVRRLGEATGSLVMRLARISHAGITAEDLRPGQWRHLSLDELIALKRDFGVPRRVRAAGGEAWEVQTKANAKVPRVAPARRPADDSHARAGRERSAAGPERSAAGRERSAVGRERSAAGRERSAVGRERSAAGRERSAAGRERSGAGRERSAAGRERSAVNERKPAPSAGRGAPREERPSKALRVARPSESRHPRAASSARLDRDARPAGGSQARPEQRPRRDAAPTAPAAPSGGRGGRVNARDARGSSRRRGT